MVDEDGVVIDADYGRSMKERQAVGLLRPYEKARGAEKEKEGIGAALKAYLEEHDGTVLFDGESELEAKLGFQKYKDYDVDAMPVSLVIALWEAHALRVDKAVLEALEGHDIAWVDAQRYKRELTGRTILQVRRRTG